VPGLPGLTARIELSRRPGPFRGQVAQATIQALVKHGVSMTSTLAVYEPFVANRPTKEPRVLNAMAPEVRASYMQTRQEIDSSGAGPITLEGLKSAMAFEREFVDAGGNLAAGGTPRVWAARWPATATSETMSYSSKPASRPRWPSAS